jgi:hypothetical protein
MIKFSEDLPALKMAVSKEAAKQHEKGWRPNAVIMNIKTASEVVAEVEKDPASRRKAGHFMGFVILGADATPENSFQLAELRIL